MFISVVLAFLAYAEAQCSNTCPPTQVLNLDCVCIPKLNCSLINDDPIDCYQTNAIGYDCVNNGAKCPKKCYCDIISGNTNNCPPCYNGGSVDSRCRCTCLTQYTGDRCQSTKADPKYTDDPEFCSLINCRNATTSQVFECAYKCLQCQNKQCDNLGMLNASCGCDCIDDNLYAVDSSTTRCKLTTCSNNKNCAIQLKSKVPGNCEKFLLVRTLCPQDCGLC
jgi:hypothetical protein